MACLCSVSFFLGQYIYAVVSDAEMNESSSNTFLEAATTPGMIFCPGRVVTQLPPILQGNFHPKKFGDQQVNFSVSCSEAKEVSNPQSHRGLL